MPSCAAAPSRGAAAPRAHPRSPFAATVPARSLRGGLSMCGRARARAAFLNQRAVLCCAALDGGDVRAQWRPAAPHAELHTFFATCAAGPSRAGGRRSAPGSVGGLVARGGYRRGRGPGQARRRAPGRVVSNRLRGAAQRERLLHSWAASGLHLCEPASGDRSSSSSRARDAPCLHSDVCTRRPRALGVECVLVRARRTRQRVDARGAGHIVSAD